MKTMIQLEKTTAKLVKSFAITKSETYDEIINRILKQRTKGVN